MTAQTAILLPVFNGARFLREQLDSILAQSAPDFTLLTLDDGSTDGSGTILSEYAARDPRVRIIPANGNRGQTERLRQLLEHADAALVMIADQDDVWAPDRNAQLIAALGDHALAFGRSDLIDADGRPLGTTLLASMGLTPDPQARVRTLLRPLASAHGAVFRRDWLDPAVFTQPMPFDWLMTALALHGPGVGYCDAAVVRHRIHGGNQMNRAGPAVARRFGALRNRLTFIARRPGQLRFWLMLDFLGRRLPDRAPRTLFAGLAMACRTAWFGPPAPRVSDRALEHELAERLRPLAGSPADWDDAWSEIVPLTRSLLHPGKLADVARNLRPPPSR